MNVQTHQIVACLKKKASFFIYKMNCSQTELLLRKYYNNDSDCIPQLREKSNWIPENNFGFLLGIITFGMNTHITQLHSLLVSSQFEEQEQSFIDSMFDLYIRPFHKNFNENSCHTPSKDSSRPSSRPSTAKEEDQQSFQIHQK